MEALVVVLVVSFLRTSVDLYAFGSRLVQLPYQLSTTLETNKNDIE